MILYAGGYLPFYMPNKQSRIELECIQPAPLNAVLKDIGIPFKEVRLVVINGKIVDLDNAVVTNQDQVKVYSPIDGG